MKKDRQRTNFNQTLLLVVLYSETLKPIGFSLAYWLVSRSLIQELPSLLCFFYFLHIIFNYFLT